MTQECQSVKILMEKAQQKYLDNKDVEVCHKEAVATIEWKGNNYPSYYCKTHYEELKKKI